MTGGHIHATHDTQIKIIVILKIKNEMYNIDNTKNDNNYNDSNNEAIIIIMIVVSQNN